MTLRVVVSVKSPIGAGDRPGAGSGRSIDVGDPTAACANIYREYGAGGDIGDGVIELVDGLRGVGLGVPGNDSGAIR